MKRLLIDMDGVLADVYAQFIKYEQNETGTAPSLKELTGKLEKEAFKNHDTYVNTPNFFASAMPMPDCIDVMRKLNEAYQIFIVSAAMQFPNSLTEKYNWLNTHFPFLQWTQIVFCGTKEVVYGDIMIDDHFKNLDHFKGQTILYTQPHNSDKPNGKHNRVHNWKEIEAMLL